MNETGLEPEQTEVTEIGLFHFSVSSVSSC